MTFRGSLIQERVGRVQREASEGQTRHEVVMLCQTLDQASVF